MAVGTLGGWDSPDSRGGCPVYICVHRLCDVCGCRWRDVVYAVQRDASSSSAGSSAAGSGRRHQPPSPRSTSSQSSHGHHHGSAKIGPELQEGSCVRDLVRVPGWRESRDGIRTVEAGY